jgi:hypothetical protein
VLTKEANIKTKKSFKKDENERIQKMLTKEASIKMKKFIKKEQTPKRKNS